ncbi:hypothetical protein ACHCAK_26850 [Raoultella ornithinolytica]|uniref:Uncharacterized protein n=1 Tax=Salmonella infantis TaxID=595 RepID=A0A726J2A2_SALIN|nr:MULTISPECIES: hypothetical protein [Enterobacterales]EAA3363748.1 hypothetical protein [Salmonella enterica]EAW1095333.1 hypothetical protein [Salmonella enterica subsp. enterica serovar Albany]EDT6092004.1 hypothetical protein [Salmonella enterica subsp. enterica serovar Ealing]EEL1572579.1 hypothetical protein [Salmonella enterica subsp. enterica serovar Thompson]EGF6331656.1 hypothetical protein [Salmonella enterica subsp. enterica serovar Mbandaka]EJQ1335262.1 hypothetical protein [Cro
MKLNNPLEVATITTNILAHYVYQAISDLDNEDLIEYDNVDSIKDYLDSSIDSLGTDSFYSSVLNSFYGMNHDYGHDYFDTEEELKEYVLKSNLYLIHDSLAVDDVSDEYDACEQALEMLEADRNDSDE